MKKITSRLFGRNQRTQSQWKGASSKNGVSNCFTDEKLTGTEIKLLTQRLYYRPLSRKLARREEAEAETTIALRKKKTIKPPRESSCELAVRDPPTERRSRLLYAHRKRSVTVSPSTNQREPPLSSTDIKRINSRLYYKALHKIEENATKLYEKLFPVGSNGVECRTRQQMIDTVERLHNKKTSIKAPSTSVS